MGGWMDADGFEATRHEGRGSSMPMVVTLFLEIRCDTQIVLPSQATAMDA